MGWPTCAAAQPASAENCKSNRRPMARPPAAASGSMDGYRHATRDRPGLNAPAP
jgi:hypothetical protein